ncbi:unnamed protein product [Vitrella brassicaformis CCMP3155]|uniref:glutathione transferase n=2 Tax=Vitrella brassicaformis TaxID=1169539 RepID=A0A0G4G201_VITBC|nr:unnamed protein product [Vitrella brassicaformis CCMP3155]|eukprot:CEM22076.1 unnamed protein product [Vitrella brassicaformis CCMP3155]
MAQNGVQNGAPKVVLGYWDIRGLAQPCRLLLEYSNVPFEDKKYALEATPEGGWSAKSWLDVKHTLGVEFSNLPYMIDGDVKISQTNAIMRHICRNYNPKLLGEGPHEMARVDMCADVVMDYRNTIVKVAYGPDFDTNFKAWVETTMSKFLKCFSDHLADKEWLVGKQITFPDFHLYELLDQTRLMKKDALDEYGNLKAYCDRFEALPAISSYMKSSRFMARPVNNRMAGFK